MYQETGSMRRKLMMVRTAERVGGGRMKERWAQASKGKKKKM